MKWRQIVEPISVVIVVLFIMWLSFGVVGVARDVLKSLVDANAALLGFLGLIVVFALNSYREVINRTEENIFRLKEKHEQESKATKEYSPGLETSYRVFQERTEELEKKLKRLRTSTKAIYSTTIRSAIYFVASIFFCLLSMSEMETAIRTISTYLTFTLLVLGVVTIFNILDQLRKTL